MGWISEDDQVFVGRLRDPLLDLPAQRVVGNRLAVRCWAVVGDHAALLGYSREFVAFPVYFDREPPVMPVPAQLLDEELLEVAVLRQPAALPERAGDAHRSSLVARTTRRRRLRRRFRSS